MTNSRWSRAALVVTSLGVSAGLLLARWPLLTTRRFDPDEFEHVHAAWYIHLGQVPYRDFFEHHTPLFQYLIAGLLSWFDAARSPEDAMRALFAVRHLTWGFSVVIVGLTFLFARRMRDATTAWVALPLISGSIVIALRAIEIRPDGLSTILWLLCLVSLHAALSGGNPSAPRARWCFAGAGLAIGLAVLTSQKLLLAGPAIALILGWYLVDGRFGGDRRARLVSIASFGFAVAAPWALALIWFARHGAASDFLRFTLFDNLKWKSETTAGSILTFITRYEPWSFALAAAGAALLVGELRRGRAISNAILLSAAAGLFAGLFVVPVPYAQYCLTFLPLFAILAAVCVVETARTLAAPAALSIPRPTWPFVIALAAFGVLAVNGLMVARPVVVAPAVYPLLVLCGLIVFLIVPRYGCADLALVVAVVVLAVFPAQWSRWMLALGDEGQFVELRYVLEQTRPDDVVMDGWSGLGALRRHADYYWMLHPGVRAMLPRAEVDRIVQAVTSGRVAPAVIVLDDNLRQLSPEFNAFVETQYRRSGVGQIYVRR